MRLPRLSVANVPQHVIVRGNKGESVFKRAHDCKSYLIFLQDAAEKYQSSVHAYILMANHIHLLISSQQDDGVSRTIQALARHYVPYFNQRYERSGALFNARYRSALVEQGRSVLEVYRYIEDNPVRSRLCEEPSQYQWSSFHANALGVADPVIAPAPEYLNLGDCDERRKEHYLSFFDREQDSEQLNIIRKQTNRSQVIGSETFREIIEKRFGICLREKQRGGDRRSKVFRRASLTSALT